MGKHVMEILQNETLRVTIQPDDVSARIERTPLW